MGEAAECEGGHARGNQRAEVEPILMTDSRTRPAQVAIGARGSARLITSSCPVRGSPKARAVAQASITRSKAIVAARKRAGERRRTLGRLEPATSG
jgi:hypothetical protein